MLVTLGQYKVILVYLRLFSKSNCLILATFPDHVTDVCVLHVSKAFTSTAYSLLYQQFNDIAPQVLRLILYPTMGRIKLTKLESLPSPRAVRST